MPQTNLLCKLSGLFKQWMDYAYPRNGHLSEPAAGNIIQDNPNKTSLQPSPTKMMLTASPCNLIDLVLDYRYALRCAKY